MDNKYSLKWNDFNSNLTTSMSFFRNKGYLNDVTLVTDDHQQISAQRFVLSMCSEYFQQLFDNNNLSNIVICLEGVSTQDLNNCLDFMYNGEIQIFQNDLNRFLKIAHRFKIKGVTEDNINDEEVSKLAGEELISEEFFKTLEENFDHSIEENFDKNIEEKFKSLVDHNGESISDWKTEANKYIQKMENGSVKCTVCGRVFADRNKMFSMRRHVETHLEGYSYSCNSCNQTYKTNNSLNLHMYKKHRV